MNAISSAQRPARPLAIGYRSLLFILALSGFAQMPIFKRYYVADVPGLGWLAEFFITHLMHYAGAVLFLMLAAYLATAYLMAQRHQTRMTRSGWLQAGLLAGIAITGIFLVVKNLSGVYFSPGVIVVLNLAHLALVMGFLATAVVCRLSKKGWTSDR